MADDVNLSIGVDTAAAVKSIENLEKTAVGTADKIGKAFVAAGAAVAAFVAGRAVVNFLEEGIKSAIAEEQAMARLGAQLIATGEDSEEARKAFSDMANELEGTTKFGDDAALSAAALAKSYGLTNDQAIQLTKAAADLASATGDTLEGAVEQLTASYSGNIKAIGKLVPEVKGLTKEQLAAGDAVDLIAKRFQGAANAEIQTFGGAIIQAGNAFDDFRKAIGEIITDSPVVIAAINAVGEAFGLLNQNIDDNKSAVTTALETFIKISAAFASSVVPAAQAVIRVFGFIINSVPLALTGLMEFFKEFAKIADAVVGFLPGFDDKKLTKLFDYLGDAAAKAAVYVDDGFTKVDDTLGNVSESVDSVAQKIFNAGETSQKSMKKASDSTAKYGRTAAITADEVAKLREDGKKFLESLAMGAASEQEKIVLEAKKSYEELARFAYQGSLAPTQIAQAALLIRETQINKEIELNKKLYDKMVEDAKKASEEARKAVEEAAANPITFVMKGDFSNSDAIAGAGVGMLGKMLEGAAGAKSLIAAGAGAIGDALIPGIGGAVSSVVSKLAEGPEATKQFIKEFIAAIPDIMTAIAESIPVVVETFVDVMVNKGGAVRIAMAMIRAMSGEAIWKSIGNQLGISVGNAFNGDMVGRKIANGFLSIGDKLKATFSNLGKILYDSAFGGIIQAGQQFLTSFGEFITNMPTAFLTVFTDLGKLLVSALQSFFTVDLAGILNTAFKGIFDFFSVVLPTLATNAFSSIINFFRDTFSNLIDKAFGPIIKFFENFNIKAPSLGGLGGGGGSVLGGLAKTASSFIPKFADGGIVYAANGFMPRGTDTVPAMLTPGEMVLNRGQQASLFSLANGGGSENTALLRQLVSLLSEPTTTAVTAEVNGKAIADIVLQQSRQRARLSA